MVGLGYWGPNLVRNLAANPDIELVAVCDQSEERIARMRRTYPAVNGVTRTDDLLTLGLDLVAVATPVFTHYGIARQLLESGINVLVEKPIAGSVREAEELVALASQKGLHLFVDHPFVFTGAVEEIAKQIQSGALGRLLYIDSVRINLGLFQPDVDVVWDLAPHDLSILGYLLGRGPKTVTAMGGSHSPSNNVDVAYLHLDYGDALTAHVHVSWLSPVKVRRMFIAGVDQSLIFDDLDQDTKVKIYDHGVAFDVSDDETRRSLLVSYRKGQMVAPAIAPSEALSVQVAEIAAVLRGKAAPRAPGSKGLEVVRILEASSRSLREGGSVVRLED